MFASDSDRDVEITSSRSAPETSYSMDMPSAPSRPSISHSPLASAAPAASTSGDMICCAFDHAGAHTQRHDAKKRKSKQCAIRDSVPCVTLHTSYPIGPMHDY